MNLFIRVALVVGVMCGGVIADGPTIQDLVDAAKAGDEIRVPGGVYPGAVLIDRPISLVADGEAVIQGSGRGDVLTITAPDVSIRGFRITGTGDSLDRENAGIVVTADRVVIEDNRLDDVLFGIYLKESRDSVIRNNRIGGKPLPEPRRGDAIRLWQSPGALIEGNVVKGSRDLIMWFSDDVVLRGNRVSDGRYGMHFMYSNDNLLEDNVLVDNSVGAFLMYSRDLVVRRNVIARNRGPSGFGIGLKDLDGLLAEDNLLIGNRVGLHLDNSPSEVDVFHLVRRNVLAYNDVGMGFLPNVTRNRFTENTFVDNVEQVSILGAGEVKGNEFAVDGRGNFWSDYRGYDLDDDGVGDFPYRADAFFENLVDRHPRMRLFLFSPVQHALEAAARAFPVVGPTARITDPSPLVEMVKPRIDVPSSPRLEGSVASLVLLAIGLMCLAPAAMLAERRFASSMESRSE